MNNASICSSTQAASARSSSRCHLTHITLLPLQLVEQCGYINQPKSSQWQVLHPSSLSPASACGNDLLGPAWLHQRGLGGNTAEHMLCTSGVIAQAAGRAHHHCTQNQWSAGTTEVSCIWRIIAKRQELSGCSKLPACCSSHALRHSVALQAASWQLFSFYSYTVVTDKWHRAGK